MTKCALLAAIVALWLQPLLASNDTAKQQEALKKIEQAVANTNIFELPSFRMKAIVQILSMGKLVDGSYELLWNGPEQWREEILFPGYSEVQVGGKGTVWIQRSTDFYPLSVYFLHAALGFGSGAAGAIAEPVQPGHTVRPWSLVQLNLSERDKVTNIHERKEHGETQACIEYENVVKRLFEICVSESTNTLVRSPAYVDKELKPVGGGKAYPRFLSSIDDDGRTLAKANVTEFTTPVQFPPNSFTPPTGVSPQAGCMNPTPFQLINGDFGEYPLNAGIGVAIWDAWIGLDGLPRIVGYGGMSAFDRSSKNAIKKWRYEPATCNGKPVEVETVLLITYAYGWFGLQPEWYK